MCQEEIYRLDFSRIKKENRVSRHDSLRLIVKCIQGCDYIVYFVFACNLQLILCKNNA